MSTPAVVEPRGSVQALEDAFWRRLKIKKEDAAAAALAEELFVEVGLASDKGRLGEATYRLVAVGKKAMELWVGVKGPFPAVRTLLWDAVLEGWLADPIGQSVEEETAFARFIATTGNAEDQLDPKTENILHGHTRDALDHREERLVAQKVARLLMNITDEEAYGEMCQVVYRSFSRYAGPDKLRLLAHVYNRIRLLEREGFMLFPHVHANAEEIARVTSDAVQIVHLAHLMTSEQPPLEKATIILVSSDEVMLRFEPPADWKECNIVPRIADEKLAEAVHSVELWREDHGRAKKFKVTVVYRLHPNSDHDCISKTI